ncbi:hypothetical protein [Thermomonas hydrothermalis]|uniref:Lipoprotein n=1 Tax=Thermomonas hydrothermalis TaxID=213588 RepID=A0A1M4XCS8_9GAMM|nr:hypothetical protein [Thermomonas hydrothermalis]MCL6618922.1 hypothetical protein [Thermomonas hydrothermalis]SHE91347.1 hypothetical protein SAMN02745204_01401 [Thermomonas hydrothermalis]
MDRLLRFVLASALLAPASHALAQDTQTGDVLLIQRIRQEPANLPARGMTAPQVEARYGAPAQRLQPVGGQKRAWPVIERWVYPQFTVYFEKNRVVDAVANKASPDELGPKPASR